MSQDCLEINVGLETYEFVRLRIVGWSVNDDFGGWWIDCDVTASIGTFTARLETRALMSAELLKFLEGLEMLYQKLDGIAELNALDDWLSMQFVGNGSGGIALKAVVRDLRRNELTFQLNLDQTFLPRIIQQTKRVLEAVR